MTREEAAKILDPETTLDTYAKISYYGGFEGENVWQDAVNEACRMGAAALRELDAKEKQESFGEWISVKDRLPGDEQEVLVIAHGWDGRLVYVGSHKRVEAQKSWLTGITNKSSEWSLWGWSYLKEPIVTHWLPMPEPPEEGKNNEM